MADDADRAQIELERAEERLKKCIEAARLAPVATSECQECGEEKSPNRFHLPFCIDCQLRYERLNRP